MTPFSRTNGFFCWRILRSACALILAVSIISMKFVSPASAFGLSINSGLSRRISSVDNKGGCDSRRRNFSTMTVLMEPKSSSQQRPQRRSSKPSSFAQRMRSIVKKDATTTETDQLPTLDRTRSNVRTARNLSEFKAILQENQDKFIVVRWFAPWCRACKAIEPLFYKLSNSYDNVIFVEVPVTEKNSDLHQGLGVPSLPFCHIYHPTAGLVEEMKILKPQFSQLKKTLQWYVYGSCDLPDGESSSPF